MKRMTAILSLVLISSSVFAAGVPPEGFVWDSTKKYLAPSIITNVIAPEVISEWQKARETAILLVGNTLNSPNSHLTSQALAILKIVVRKLKEARLSPATLSEKILHDGFDLESERFDGETCAKGRLLAFVAPAFDDKLIHLCRFGLFAPNDNKPQILIHESIHLSGLADEIATSQLEHQVMRTNGILPIPNGYVNSSNSTESFAEPVDFSTERYRPYTDPLIWAQRQTARACEIKVEYQESKRIQTFKFTGRLLGGSPYVYPNSIMTKPLLFGGKGAETDLSKEMRDSVLLLERGSNTFIQKLLNASSVGAVAGLIFERKQSSEDWGVGDDNTTLATRKQLIPFVQISQSDGEKLESLIARQQGHVSIACEFN